MWRHRWWVDAVAVALLQHAEVFVAELVGDVFDGESSVG
jgi:hypothetical protein